MIIVPNEWLVELILGSREDQRRVHGFLDRIDAGEGLLAIRYPPRGRLAQKILSAMGDPHARAKRLKLMLSDDSKVRLVSEDEIVPLPPELERAVKAGDRYLVETAFSVRPCVLVTTDGPLHEVLCGHGDPTVQSRLLHEYLSS